MATVTQKTSKKEETVVVSEGPPGIVRGYLEEVCSVDIVVNSAPVHMKLASCGRVSRAILERAGPAIQDECDEKYPNGIKLGDIAITSGYKLPYSIVFHCTVEPMTAANCHVEMAKVIKKCLMEADDRYIVTNSGLERKAQTIAFPLLGTGGKGLSPEICKVFYRTMLSFLLGPTKSLINSFIIVTPKDQHLIDIIKQLKPYTELQQSTYEFCYPKTWQETQNNLDVFKLNEECEEYVLVADEFLMCTPPGAKILEIQRIQNKTLYKKFLENKCRHKLLKKIHERQLWFPAEDATDASQLYTHGLDDNHIKAQRNGQGYCFAGNAFLADDMRLTRNQPLKMFFCSVVTGRRLILGNHSYKKGNLPTPRCFSTVNHVEQPTIYTIFDEHLFYPKYLVTFQGQ